MIGIVMVFGLISASAAIPCEEARLRCAYREGCGQALQAYVMGCSAKLHESPPDECPQICQHALIALTSSNEGEDLVTCECADRGCRDTKERLRVCEPHVRRAMRNDSIVTCETAQWICLSDASCSTALDYYHKYCESMFEGIKCSNRCKNSISILKKQEKAAKLDTCRCEGNEDYDCDQIRRNMAKLCFNKEPQTTPDTEDTNDIKSNGVNKNTNIHQNTSKPSSHSSKMVINYILIGFLLLIQ